MGRALVDHQQVGAAEQQQVGKAEDQAVAGHGVARPVGGLQGEQGQHQPGHPGQLNRDRIEQQEGAESGGEAEQIEAEQGQGAGPGRGDQGAGEAGQGAQMQEQRQGFERMAPEQPDPLRAGERRNGQRRCCLLLMTRSRALSSSRAIPARARTRSSSRRSGTIGTSGSIRTWGAGVGITGSRGRIRQPISPAIGNTRGQVSSISMPRRP